MHCYQQHSADGSPQNHSTEVPILAGREHLMHRCLVTHVFNVAWTIQAA